MRKTYFKIKRWLKAFFRKNKPLPKPEPDPEPPKESYLVLPILATPKDEWQVKPVLVMDSICIINLLMTGVP